MKVFAVTIEGTADLLMNGFPMDAEQGSKKSSVAKDHSDEWRQKLYLMEDGRLYQPESHILGCLVKAAVTEKIPGRRGKTYKDAVNGGVFVRPSYIPHTVSLADLEKAPTITGPAPDTFKGSVYIDRRPVRVQRARVMRYRPAIVKGWELRFELEVLDDDFRPDALKAILDTGGREVGIGDFRPRFGRFMVTCFEEISC